MYAPNYGNVSSQGDMVAYNRAFPLIITYGRAMYKAKVITYAFGIDNSGKWMSKKAGIADTASLGYKQIVRTWPIPTD